GMLRHNSTSAPASACTATASALLRDESMASIDLRVCGSSSQCENGDETWPRFGAGCALIVTHRTYTVTLPRIALFSVSVTVSVCLPLVRSVTQVALTKACTPLSADVKV